MVRLRSFCVPLLALVIVVAACTAGTEVSTTDSIPITSASTSSSTVAVSSSTLPTAVGAESSASDCGTNTSAAESTLTLPAGLDDPPYGTEFVGSRRRGLVSEALWEVPEPEDGVQAGDPDTEAFLESFVMIRLWTADVEAALPPVATPWWAAEQGFPESQDLVDDSLGVATIDILFENRPGDGIADAEEWFVVTWSVGDLAARMLTRGLGVDEALGVARSVTTDVEVDGGVAFVPSEGVVARVSATLGMTIEAALPVLLDSGFCEIEFMDVDGNPVSPVASDQSRIVGTEFPRAGKLIVITDT
ncbi:MAG: hypothetical protein GXP36_11995 [Actinobacteria bacterium]|nr:hypothetical protein [Actinomycetota bacterium]